VSGEAQHFWSVNTFHSRPRHFLCLF